ncbi:probable G-protein coupled receptor No18 [Haliotis rubra]|uniref:probable G-protein coupled receptor No18 n=1 Tax=Haliotis rubra TaxID=36100 RepID=UPI001EE58CA2|nr:probable G-protein coupled receptor No18 [Haliotis rubra]
MFIVSLAIADLIVGLSVMPISTVYIFTTDWLFGVAVCQIWIGIDYIASTASILNLFILSLDRYWSVTAPLLYLRKRTKKRALIMISCVWTASCLWIIPIVGWHHIAHGGVRTVENDVCDTEYARDSVFKIVTAFFNFYLPLAVMYSLYWKIFQEIRKRSEFELGQRNCGTVPTYITGPQPSHSGDESEHRDDTFTDDNTHSIPEDPVIASRTIQNAHFNGRSVSTKSRDGYKNLRLVAVKRQMSAREARTPAAYRVEYIYDESVIDPQTERIERYYYEEHLPLQIKNPGAVAGNCRARSETSSSHSSSSASTFEDRPNDKHERTLSRGENYSLISGIRRIRQAERLLDKTVAVSDGSRQNSREKNLFVLRDDKNRRLTGMLNIKERIKTFRQSSSLTKEIKAARQLGVIMGAFTVCFLPYFILFLVVAFCDDCIDPGLLTAMTWVGYLNSTLNPFLYPLCNQNFRRKFRKMLQVCGPSSPRRGAECCDRNSITNARFD